MTQQLDANYNADLLDAEWSLIEDNGTFVGFQTINEWEGVIYDDEDAS